MLNKLIFGLIFLIVASVLVSTLHFNKQVHQEIALLFSDNQNPSNSLTPTPMEHLPPPIQRWLTHSGVLEQEPIHTVYLRQKGLLRLKPEQDTWLAAEAEQYFSVDTPGFLWRVKLSMMGLPVMGRDLFQHGHGSMLIKLAGVLPVVQAKDHAKLDQSTLQRFLGETVWFPSAARLPYIQWTPVDDHCAKATMTIGDASGSVFFHVDDAGDLSHIIAYRYKETTDAQPTEWVAKVLKTDVVNNVRMPVKLEATWRLKDGDFTWYTFEIHDVQFNPVWGR